MSESVVTNLESDAPAPSHAICLWPLLVAIRSRIRRSRSLRWRTKRALRELQESTSFLRRPLTSLSTLSWAGRPWFLPFISIALVLALHLGQFQWTPLTVFNDTEVARGLLGVLWQVEGASIALVLTASLFAFDSLTRRRPNIPLVEYANRSRLLPFMMLAASGLLAIPVALFLGPEPSAGFVAGLIAALSLGLLPFFFWRTIRVVDPSWLRQQRLITIRRTTQSVVDKEAYERLALAELRNWAESKERVMVEHRSSLVNLPVVLKASSREGIVMDIDLGLLEVGLAQSVSTVVVITRLDDVTEPDSPLIVYQGEAKPQMSRRAVILSRL